ncbi:MAG: hypothetical protein AcusKO_25480 [Acuticoccus sp.]
MFHRIMAPVDLAHIAQLDRALQCTADLAKQYGVPVTYVSVTSSAPTSIAHNPQEFDAKLTAFAKGEADKHGIEATSHMILAHDPSIDIDGALRHAIDETEADLVVMASHVPGRLEYIWHSHGGRLAEHAKCSVFIVRP